MAVVQVTDSRAAARHGPTTRLEAAPIIDGWKDVVNETFLQNPLVYRLDSTMTSSDKTKKIHDLDVTVWIGKRGIDAVAEELESQLEENDLVKVKFLRSARGRSTTDELADELAAAANADIVQTRGNTAVYQ